jgi:hypothetical protein
MKKLLLALALAVYSLAATAQFGGSPTGLTADPCFNPNNAKSSAVINISTATTTSIVAAVAGATVYVCDFVITISQVATTANTLKFVTGTGATCGTGTTDLTGAFGAGGVTAAAPIVIASASTGTTIKSVVGGGICATTTIGATASFVGVLIYVQQTL